MALIKCPHCGKLISPSATECVHCGGKIKVCHDCGKPYKDGAEQCPNCGYKSSAENDNKNSSVTKSNSTQSDMPFSLKDRLNKNVAVPKAIRIAGLVLGLVSIAFLLIGVIGIIPSSAVSLNEKQARAMVIVGALLFNMDFILGRVAYAYPQAGCGLWLKRNGFDISQNIKTAGGQNKSSSSPYERDYKNLSAAAYVCANPKSAALFIIPEVVVCIGMIILDIGLVIVLMQLIDKALAALNTGAELNYTFNSFLRPVLPYFIVVAVSIVIAFPFNIVFNKKKKNWLQSL